MSDVGELWCSCFVRSILGIIMAGAAQVEGEDI